MDLLLDIADLVFTLAVAVFVAAFCYRVWTDRHGHVSLTVTRSGLAGGGLTIKGHSPEVTRRLMEDYLDGPRKVVRSNLAVPEQDVV